MGEQKTVLVLSAILISLVAVVPVAGASGDDYWVELKSMPTARSGLGVAVVDGKIYAIGGSNGSFLGTNEMYDPETDTWTTKAPMPTPRSSFAITAYQNKIYVIGGFNGDIGSLQTNQVYDTLTDTWESKCWIPYNGHAHCCANVVNGKIYLIGGDLSLLPPAPISDKTYVYDPINDSWTTKTPMPTPAWGYASAVIDNKIYIMGGLFTPNDALTSTNIYDPETDTWSQGKTMPFAMSFAGAGATKGLLAPKRIYVIDGETSLGYDPLTDLWTTGASMLTTRSGVGVAVVDDILYVIGGYNESTQVAVNEAYIPVGYTGDFTPPDYVSPVVTVDSPMNATYSTNDVTVTFTVDEEASWMGYSLDGENNVTTTENTVTLTGLPNGVHNITVYANDTSGNTGKSETFVFTVAKEPAQVEWTIIVLVVAIVAVVAVAAVTYYRKTRQNQSY